MRNLISILLTVAFCQSLWALDPKDEIPIENILNQWTAMSVNQATEGTVVATAWPIDRGASWISIGRPIANTRVYILDQHRRPVPVGVAAGPATGTAP